MNFRMHKIAGALSVAATMLVGCGGNQPIPAKVAIKNVYVMGDSVADVGTYGLKFTIQDSSNSQGFPIWPQFVADDFGLQGAQQCSFFKSNGSYLNSLNAFYKNPSSGCTNYAIGGSTISTMEGLRTGNPMNIGVQLQTRAADGSYGRQDLVLIEGGGNDAANLVFSYFGASTQQGLAAYIGFLSDQLDVRTISDLLGQSNGANLAASAYMQSLADTFYGQIGTYVLKNGATHVAILNMPDITLTPRLRTALAGIAAQAGSGAATQLQTAIQSWISTYNARLATNARGDSRITVIDFFGSLTDEVSNPGNFSLTNVTAPSCPATGIGPDGLPASDFATCTTNALDAMPGKSPGWWKGYAFSDGFHPSPYAHHLLANSVSRALERAGWL